MADGQVVVYQSGATNIVGNDPDTNGVFDIIRWKAGVNTRVNTHPALGVTQANGSLH